MDAAQQLIDRFNAFDTSVKSISSDVKHSLGEHNARLMELEQKAAGSGFFRGGSEYKSVGQMVAEHDAVEMLRKNGGRGSARVAFETKALSSVVGSTGVLVAPDRQSEIITLPRRTPRIRDLLAVGTTASNTIHFNREKTVTNNAAMAAEGT